MTKKGNGFIRFVFSLLPGAGEMYMGFMKMGTSLMGLFFAVIILASVIDIGPIIMLGVIVWFYSFFHVHNLASMPDDRFAAVQDDYLIKPGDDSKGFVKKYRKAIAVILIICGVVLLWHGVTDIINDYFPDYISDAMCDIGRLIPKFVAGAAVILLGIFMIKGKAGELGIENRQQGGQENAGK